MRSACPLKPSPANSAENMTLDLQNSGDKANFPDIYLILLDLMPVRTPS